MATSIRLLAHAKVESVKSKEASRRKGTLKKSWWSFGWFVFPTVCYLSNG